MLSFTVSTFTGRVTFTRSSGLATTNMYMIGRVRDTPRENQFDGETYEHSWFSLQGQPMIVNFFYENIEIKIKIKLKKEKQPPFL